MLSPSHPRLTHVEVAVGGVDPLGRADPAEYDVAGMRMEAMQMRVPPAKLSVARVEAAMPWAAVGARVRVTAVSNRRLGRFVVPMDALGGAVFLSS